MHNFEDICSLKNIVYDYKLMLQIALMSYMATAATDFRYRISKQYFGDDYCHNTPYIVTLSLLL